MKFSKAIEGFLLHKSVEGMSPRTLETHQYQLNRLNKYLDDPDISSITPTDLRRFFHYLRHEYTPKRINGDQSSLTGASLRHNWVACRSFYTWAVGELGVEDALAPIPAPKTKWTQPNPLTKDEVKSLVQSARTEREHCILLILLDTGLRASELCALKVGDVDLKTGKVFVIGKGNKERYCYLGKVTRRWLWKYLAGRDAEQDNPLFTNRDGRPVHKWWLHNIVTNIGKRAGVPKVYPHRFRHTFAVQFLRNGGDVFTLQILLGHSSLKMVRRYAALADVDAERAHRKASPTDNWLR